MSTMPRWAERILMPFAAFGVVALIFGYIPDRLSVLLVVAGNIAVMTLHDRVFSALVRGRDA